MFVAGGSVDTLARQFGNRFTQQNKGSSVIIDNRPGAGGTITGTTVEQRDHLALTVVREQHRDHQAAAQAGAWAAQTSFPTLRVSFTASLLESS